MTVYKTLQIIQFRSYKEYSVSFDGGVTIIVGPNGSGKTNLLEALHVVSAGGSFRGTDREIVSHGEQWFRLEAAYGEQQRVVTSKMEQSGKVERQCTVDGVKKARFSHGQRVPIVLFEPDHLRLLSGSPARRREYLDTLLVKMYPDYSWLKHQFERVLLQRNSILKSRFSPAVRDDQLFVWDIKFADLSAKIVERRNELIGRINQDIAGMYSTIARRSQDVRLTYQSTVLGQDYQAGIMRLLQENIGRDVERGYTGIGPHRDDFTTELNNSSAASSASRGEVRSLLLALKIIELQMLRSQNDVPPLLLLDDVFSELDSTRRQTLAQLASDYQTFITTTDADVIADNFNSGYEVIKTTL